MGKSAKWFKNVLLGKKSSKSSNGSKGYERVVNGNEEVVVTTKVEESDLSPSSANAAAIKTLDGSSGVLETQDLEPEDISVDEKQILLSKPSDSQNDPPVQDNTLSNAERIQQEIAATTVQAVFRGYLARRAFRALKGIIRLQALIRGHLVRRQAVATLCCVMGIVRLQALARGRKIRNSVTGVNYQENKVVNSTDAYFGIKKLTANAFALKLLASSPKVIPLHIPYDSSNPNSRSVWLENWSASWFWKPVPQPSKRTMGRRVTEDETAKPKKSVRTVPAVQTSFEFEKPKRSFRKVSRQSIEPPALEDPQVELEKVKRSLRKVHNPVVESSIQVPYIQVEKKIEKNPMVHETKEEPVNVFEEIKKQQVPEQLEVVHTPGPLETNEALDTSLVNQIGEANPSMENDATVEKTPKPINKEQSAGKENQKSRKKSLDSNKTERVESNGHHHHQISPSIPSYMQATKSAKAKLRLQGSPKSVEQDGSEKARRHSLPSSGNGRNRITSSSPRTTRLASSGDKTGNKKEKPAKTTPVERKW